MINRRQVLTTLLGGLCGIVNGKYIISYFSTNHTKGIDLYKMGLKSFYEQVDLPFVVYDSKYYLVLNFKNYSQEYQIGNICWNTINDYVLKNKSRLIINQTTNVFNFVPVYRRVYEYPIVSLYQYKNNFVITYFNPQDKVAYTKTMHIVKKLSNPK